MEIHMGRLDRCVLDLDDFGFLPIPDLVAFRVLIVVITHGVIGDVGNEACDVLVCLGLGRRKRRVLSDTGHLVGTVVGPVELRNTALCLVPCNTTGKGKHVTKVIGRRTDHGDLHRYILDRLQGIKDCPPLPLQHFLYAILQKWILAKVHGEAVVRDQTIVARRLVRDIHDRRAGESCHEIRELTACKAMFHINRIDCCIGIGLQDQPSCSVHRGKASGSLSTPAYDIPPCFDIILRVEGKLLRSIRQGFHLKIRHAHCYSARSAGSLKEVKKCRCSHLCHSCILIKTGHVVIGRNGNPGGSPVCCRNMKHAKWDILE